MLRSIVKVFIFAVLVGSFSYFSSLVRHDHELWSLNRGEIKAGGLFISGAILAVWGNKEFGTIDPIPLRGMFIILGVLLMIFAMILENALREAST